MKIPSIFNKKNLVITALFILLVSTFIANIFGFSNYFAFMTLWPIPIVIFNFFKNSSIKYISIILSIGLIIINYIVGINNELISDPFKNIAIDIFINIFFFIITFVIITLIIKKIKIKAASLIISTLCFFIFIVGFIVTQILSSLVINLSFTQSCPIVENLHPTHVDYLDLEKKVSIVYEHNQLLIFEKNIDRPDLKTENFCKYNAG